ncbi:hypothetical protein CS063_01690 [Sporanaerobium hydrogeniformans]|uniref:Uncharacterized protein n=1 Tax=Sporanaerobium hydrogeniformans TaxID=3072179 RepID=A0AC61DGV9_9FIRM|nr:LytTR family DNA-binding domain-containing protein [Sporanaerobium hydrogeniformans]PHV72213.1 hypothetical protein CS063_01690 [Sporanaerobium hydrogeniformans]
MEIAIVDDLKEERILIKNLADKYFKERKERYDVTPHFEEFKNGEDFLKSYAPGKYQLVFLDIYMDKLTGIDVAKRIASLDKACSIIFFTSSNDHLLEGYDVHAVGYILKPVENHIASFYTALDYVCSKIELDQKGLIVLTNYGDLFLYYRNILYVECMDKALYIHLIDRTLKVIGKYKDYQHVLLSDDRFLECYRNIIVNMHYIDASTDCDFILKSGEKIPISRRKKASVMGKYMLYFMKGSVVNHVSINT